MRYLQDFTQGLTVDLGKVTLTTEDITEFGKHFDPQPFHVDPAAATASTFGGLVASGIHTLALFMRQFVATILADTASQGSPGMNEVLWPRPVRPGDTLSCLYEVESSRVSSSRPSSGVVLGRGQASNQHGDVVLSLSVVNIVGRRPDS